MDKKAKTGIVFGVMCLALTLGICIQIRTVKQYSTKVGQNYDQNNLRAEVLKYKEKYENQKSTKCMSYSGICSSNRTHRMWENR